MRGDEINSSSRWHANRNGGLLLIIMTLCCLQALMLLGNLSVVEGASTGNIYYKFDLDVQSWIWNRLNYNNGNVESKYLRNDTASNGGIVISSNIDMLNIIKAETFALNFTTSDGDCSVLSNPVLKIDMANFKIVLSLFNGNEWISIESVSGSFNNYLEVTIYQNSVYLNLNGYINSRINSFSSLDSFVNFISNSSMFVIEPHVQIEKLSLILQTSSQKSCFGIFADEPGVCSGKGTCTDQDVCQCENTGDSPDSECKPTSTRSRVGNFCNMKQDGYCYDMLDNKLDYTKETLLMYSYLHDGPFCSNIIDFFNDVSCQSESFRIGQAIYYGVPAHSSYFSVPSSASDSYKGEPVKLYLVDKLTGASFPCENVKLTPGLDNDFSVSLSEDSYCSITDPNIYLLLSGEFTFNFYFSPLSLESAMTLFDYVNRFKVFISSEKFLVVDLSPIAEGKSMVLDPNLKVNSTYQVTITRNQNMDGTDTFETRVYSYQGYLSTNITLSANATVDKVVQSASIGRNFKDGFLWQFIGSLGGLKYSPKYSTPSEIFNKPIVMCFGKESADPTVCSGHGSCTKNDTCNCYKFFKGDKCDYEVTCRGISGNSSLVCSGNGYCDEITEKCKCKTPYYGVSCQIIDTTVVLLGGYIGLKTNFEADLSYTMEPIVINFTTSSSKKTSSSEQKRLSKFKNNPVSYESFKDKLITYQVFKGSLLVTVDQSWASYDLSTQPVFYISSISPIGIWSLQELHLQNYLTTGGPTNSPRSLRLLSNGLQYFVLNLNDNNLLIERFNSDKQKYKSSSISNTLFTPDLIRYGQPIVRSDGTINVYMPIIEEGSNQTILILSLNQYDEKLDFFTISNDPQIIPYFSIFNGTEERIITYSEKGINVYSLSQIFEVRKLATIPWPWEHFSFATERYLLTAFQTDISIGIYYNEFVTVYAFQTSQILFISPSDLSSNEKKSPDLPPPSYYFYDSEKYVIKIPPVANDNTTNCTTFDNTTTNCTYDNTTITNCTTCGNTPIHLDSTNNSSYVDNSKSSNTTTYYNSNGSSNSTGSNGSVICTPDGQFEDFVLNLEKKYNSKFLLTLTIRKISVCGYYFTYKKQNLTELTISRPMPGTTDSFLDKLVKTQKMNDTAIITIDTSLIDEPVPNVFIVNPTSPVPVNVTLTIPTNNATSRILSSGEDFYALVLDGNQLIVYYYLPNDFNVPFRYSYCPGVFTPEQIRYGTPLLRKNGVLEFYMPIIEESKSQVQTIQKLSLTGGSNTVSSFKIANNPNAIPYFFIFDGFDESVVVVNEEGSFFYSVVVNGTSSDTELAMYYNNTKMSLKNSTRVYQTDNAIVISQADGSSILTPSDKLIEPVERKINTVLLPNPKTLYFDDAIYQVKTNESSISKGSNDVDKNSEGSNNQTVSNTASNNSTLGSQNTTSSNSSLSGTSTGSTNCTSSDSTNDTSSNNNTETFSDSGNNDTNSTGESRTTVSNNTAITNNQTLENNSSSYLNSNSSNGIISNSSNISNSTINFNSSTLQNNTDQLGGNTSISSSNNTSLNNQTNISNNQTIFGKNETNSTGIVDTLGSNNTVSNNTAMTNNQTLENNNTVSSNQTSISNNRNDTSNSGLNSTLVMNVTSSTNFKNSTQDSNYTIGINETSTDGLNTSQVVSNLTGSESLNNTSESSTNSTLNQTSNYNETIKNQSGSSNTSLDSATVNSTNTTNVVNETIIQNQTSVQNGSIIYSSNSTNTNNTNQESEGHNSTTIQNGTINSTNSLINVNSSNTINNYTSMSNDTMIQNSTNNNATSNSTINSSYNSSTTNSYSNFTNSTLNNSSNDNTTWNYNSNSTNNHGINSTINQNNSTSNGATNTTNVFNETLNKNQTSVQNGSIIYSSNITNNSNSNGNNSNSTVNNSSNGTFNVTNSHGNSSLLNNSDSSNITSIDNHGINGTINQNNSTSSGNNSIIDTTNSTSNINNGSSHSNQSSVISNSTTESLSNNSSNILNFSNISTNSSTSNITNSNGNYSTITSNSTTINTSNGTFTNSNNTSQNSSNLSSNVLNNSTSNYDTSNSTNETNYGSNSTILVSNNTSSQTNNSTISNSMNNSYPSVSNSSNSNTNSSNNSNNSTIDDSSPTGNNSSQVNGTTSMSDNSTLSHNSSNSSNNTTESNNGFNNSINSTSSNNGSNTSQSSNNSTSSSNASNSTIDSNHFTPNETLNTTTPTSNSGNNDPTAPSIPKTYCFGVEQTSNLTCFGNGICISNDTCSCLENYIGLNCSIPVCFGTPGINSSVCGGNGKCIEGNLCKCHDGFTGQLCQYQTTTELCKGSFVPAEQITVIDSNIYLQKSLMDTVCGKSLILQSTTLLEGIPSNVTNSNLLKYYTITTDVNTESGDKFLTFDTLLYKSKIPNSLIIWKIDKFSNATQMIIPIINTMDNATYGLVKIIDNPNGDLLGITLKDNSTNVTILEIDTSSKEANISSVFDKGPISFTDIDKGNQVFNPSTNTTTFTFFKEGTSNSSLLVSVNIEAPNETPKEIVIPQSTQKYFTLVLYDHPDQYLLSSDQQTTTISTIVPDIDSSSPEFNELASDSNFVVNKNDLVVLTKDTEKITVTNVNTDVSLIIAVSQLTPDSSVFDQSTQLTKFQPIAYINNDQSEATVLSIRKIYPLYVPVTGSIPIYLEGNYVLPGTRPYLILKYDPLNLILARLPVQTSGSRTRTTFKPFVNAKDLISNFPQDLVMKDSFKVSVQIELISETSDPIPISTDTELTLYRFDLLKVLPKQAYFGDRILAMATFFPPTNNVNLFIRQQYSTEETQIACTVLNSTFCSAKLPLLGTSDSIMNIRAALIQDSISSNYDTKLFIRYVDPEVVKVTSLDKFDTSISPPEDIPDQDTTPPIIQRQETTETVQPPLIIKMNIGKLNKSKCTDKPIRQVVASSDLHDISNIVSLDFKLSPFSNIENGNLIEFWISKKNNGTFFGGLSFENGKQVLSGGELSSGMKSSASCLFSSGVSYRISMKLTEKGTKWELKNINLDMIDCSLNFVSDNSKILAKPTGYQFGIGQAFSCAQLLSGISQIPELTVSSMMEVCVTCAKSDFSLTQIDYLPYIVGGSIGLLLVVAFCATLVAGVGWYFIRRKKKNNVGKYVFYDNNTSRDSTLQDLFEKINTNSSIDSTPTTTTEDFNMDAEEDDIGDFITRGVSYNTWV
ncbi:predicted protein [Naegleria gruberi]|uniref:Predicted protein n=1 Tax=Naegleria gruberi TaxID=5762 RepID=D2VHY4_NAEGR|nr:uncharacterized protein NAEGRDRAFT_68488 [Naegleria gruberi]EFC43497.1 predicted protein [Naegleria gruberi]|eukprot:XP_002676241.1 predicted protein [Naegleria gruberi strain NEG-M]